MAKTPKGTQVKDYFPGIYEKEERAHLRMWMGRILTLAALLIVVVYATKAYSAELLFQAQVGEIKISLYKDKCEAKEVANLPYLAVWEEKGKSFNGCFGVNSDLGVVMLYFPGDRSVAAVPTGVFVKATGV
jgi:hypothetical protein